MLISIGTQFNILLYSLIAGILTGVMFDFYRLLREIGQPNQIITFIEDILFWILSGIVVFTFLLYTNHAYILVYVYIYIALGIYLYMKLISTYFIKIQTKLIKGIAKFFRVIFNFILYPLQLIFYHFKIKNKKIKRKT